MTVSVRSDLSVPLGTQLFWQIRYAIATGEYLPGERLPTVREMAAALRVNANTIRSVYARLQDEGWVLARRKVGTVVADPPPRAHDEDLEAILDRAFDEALSHGVTGDELAAAAFARAAQRATVSARRIVFVECGANEAASFAAELDAALRDRVESVESTTIAQLPERLSAGDVDAVVTTAYHAEEVRRLAAHLPVVSLMPSPEFLGTVSQVARLRPGTRVGVPNPCSTPRRNVVSSLRKLSASLEIIEADSADDPDIGACEVVVIWGDQPRVAGKRNLRWSFGVDQAGLVHLRRQLGL